MELREKVIKGFECCLPTTTRYGYADCKHCPYDRPITLEGGVCECVHELMIDALELVKVQKPRVMTSSEVMDYVGYFEKNPPSEATKLPLWTESKKETGVFSGYRNVGNIRNLIHTSGLDRSYIFNQHWRCWTSRPSIEQMENTPWGGIDNGEKAEWYSNDRTK